MSRAITVERLAPGGRIGDYVIEADELGDAELREPEAAAYRATHVVLPRRARVRVTHGAVRDASVRVLREACLLEALAHPGVPRVFECGVLADRRAWSAIEDPGGVSLAARLARGPLAIADLVVVLRDVADVLRHAHGHGVVHRRLTPAAIAWAPPRAVHGPVIYRRSSSPRPGS